MDAAKMKRFTVWTQATIEAIRERAALIEAECPDAARKLREAARHIDEAWEALDEDLRASTAGVRP